MAKIVLDDITAGYAAPAKTNANNAKIEAAFENTISRDGTTPNFMLSELDMNARRVINVGAPLNGNDAVRLRDLQDAHGLGTLPVGTANLVTIADVADHYASNNVEGALAEIGSALIVVDNRTAAEIAVSAVVTDRNKDPGDIRRYGAISGGDSTVAITTAIAQMEQTNGAAVFIPAGDFISTTGQITNYTGWRIIGEDGVRSIIRFTGSGSMVIGGLYGIMRGVGFYNGASVANGLILYNAGGSSFYNVFAGGSGVGFASHGVLVNENYTGPKGNNNNMKFFACFSSGNTGCGFAIPSTGLDHNAIEFISCNGSANGGSGILLKGQANRVSRGIYEGNSRYGIEISESGDAGFSTRSVIDYPYIESNTLGGVYGGGKSLNNQIYLDGLNSGSSYTRAAGSEDMFYQPNNDGGPFIQFGDPTVFFRLHALTTGIPRLGLTPEGTSTNIPIYINGKGTGGVGLEGGNDATGAKVTIGQQGVGIQTFVHGSTTFSASASATANFPNLLPSAAYKVVLSGSGNRTFWVTGKTVTGFTLNGSSSSSDTVDWVVVL